MEKQIIQTINGIEFQVIPGACLKNHIPTFDKNAIKIQHIDYYDRLNLFYNGEEITEEIVAKVLEEIPNGLNIYLSLIPDGEDDCMEVNCDGEWLALDYISANEGYCYSTWNPEYAGVEEVAPIYSGGQTPIEKCFALTDIELGVKVVEYFIRTGKLYPCIDWVKYLD